MRKNLTCDNLTRKGITLVNNVERSGETVDHLLIHCTIVKELWTFVMFGVY